MADTIDSTKQADILRTAKRLFWKHGIRRVSIEEICREAGVSKMTFYRYFPDKIELAKTVLQSVFDHSLQEYKALMAQDIPFEEKIRQQLLMKFKGTEEISTDLIRDIYSNQDWGLGAYMQQRTEETIQMVLNDYAHAQQMGWIRKDLNLQFIVFLMREMKNWVTNEHLLAAYGDAHRLIMEVSNFFFYGILPHQPKPDE